MTVNHSGSIYARLANLFLVCVNKINLLAIYDMHHQVLNKLTKDNLLTHFISFLS
jgi:hypothetical protein